MRRLVTLLCAPLLAALLWPAAAAAQMQLEVIPLKGRTVEEIIPVIRPLLAPGGSVTGMDNRLIVKTTPQNLEQIKGVLAGIDRPLRMLRITVSQDLDAQSSGREHGLSGRYASGHVDAEIGDRRRGREGVEVGVGDGDDEIRYRARADAGTSADRNSHFVQTLEGRPAFIEAGSAVPVHYRTVNPVPGGAVVQEGVEYRDATSGFYVLPRVSGDIVTLAISPFMSNVAPGRVPAFDVQNAETTVSARLGEWIEIGGIQTTQHREDRELLSSRERRFKESRSIRIRVDALD